MSHKQLPGDPSATVVYVPGPLADPLPDTSFATLPLVPGYELLEELGRGGTGVVYKARQVKANRLVALKMILAGSQASAADLTRFRIEAEALAGLKHPGIIQVYEVGEWRPEGSGTVLPFFSLEFCPEGSLAHKLAGTPLPPREAARLVEELADAIHHAHQAGIVHRDLKPANVLLTSGSWAVVNGKENTDSLPTIRTSLSVTLKITDFGLAKRLDDDHSQTRTGVILGTPSYMAPEQASGRTGEIGPAVDVYALGAILYECLTGRPPFRAATIMETIRQLLENEPVPVRQLQPAVPRDLETIALKCLEKEPARRYGSAGELADDLKRFLVGEVIQARPVGALERGWKWARRHPTVSGLLATVIVVTAAGIAGVLWEYSQAVRQRNLAQKAEAYALKETELALQAEAKAREQTELFRRALNDSRVPLSEMAWREGQLHLARARLDEVPVDLRHWEWFYLDRLYSGGLFQFLAPSYGLEIATSPDGQWVAAGCGDGTLQVWDARTGVVRVSRQGQQRSIQSLAWSPNGLHLATAGRDGSIKVRDPQTLAECWSFQGPAQGINSVVFTPDGQRLISGGADGKVQIWGLPSRSELLSFRPGNGNSSVLCVACSPGGQRLACLTNRNTIRVHEVRTGQPLLTISGARGRSVAFSPDGRQLAGFTQGKIAIWDSVAGGEPLLSLSESGNPTCLTFSPEGRRLASATTDGKVKLWDLHSHKTLLTLHGATGSIHSLAFTSDGQRLVGSGADRRAHLWDVRPEEARLVPLAPLRDVQRLAYSSDGQFLACSTAEQTIHILNSQADAVLFTLDQLAGPVAGMAFHPSQPILAAAIQGDGVQLWDLATRRLWKTLKTSQPLMQSLTFSPDGRFLAGGYSTGSALVWELEAGQSRLLEDAGTTATAAAFSPDGRMLAVGNTDAQLRVWDLSSGELKHKLEGHQDAITAVIFSPDGRHLVSSSTDMTIRFWDPATGAPQDILEGHSGPVQALAYSPNQGQRLVSGGPQKIKFWDGRSGAELLTLTAPNGSAQAMAFHPDGWRLICGGPGGLCCFLALPTRPRLTLRGHTATVAEVAFSPDATRLVSGGADHTVRIWDPHSATLLRTLRGHPHGVHSVAFSPDGLRVVSGSRGNRGEGEIRVWEAATGQLLLNILDAKQVQHIAFSHDGKEIHAANSGQAKRWDAVTGRTLPGKPPSPPAAPSRSDLHQALIQGNNIDLIDRTPLAAEELAYRRQATVFDERWHQGEQQRYQNQRHRLAQLYHLDQLMQHRPDRSLQKNQAEVARRFTTENPESAEAWALRACLALRNGDLKGYREASGKLIKLMDVSKDPDTVALALRICGLGPQREGELQSMLQRAQKLASTQPSPDDLATYAALLLQAGQAEKALPLLERARQDRIGPAIREQLLLALTCARLNRSEDARRWLSQAAEWMDRPEQQFRLSQLARVLGEGPLGMALGLAMPFLEMSGALPSHAGWIERLEWGILREQARHLIPGT